jgi:methyl-galactoside transport system permease protein
MEGDKRMSNTNQGILTSEQEEKMLAPINKYVGDIQKKIDELRKDGTERVQYLKNHMQLVKEDRSLSKGESENLRQQDLAELQKANGLYKYPGKSKMYVKKYLMESLDSDILKEQMLKVLFERDYSIFEE